MNSQNLGVACVNSCSGHRCLPVSEGFEAEGTPPRDANNIRTIERQLQNNDGPDCPGLTDSSTSLGSKEMTAVVIAAVLPSSGPIQISLQSAMKLVTESYFAALPKIRPGLTDSSTPLDSKEMTAVVIAAALPSSGPIQNSLQSAMKLVTESYFAALPKIRKRSTEIHSGRKRAKLEMFNGPENKNEDGNLGAILEASVFEVLQALDSSSEAPVAVVRPQGNRKEDQKSSSGMENSSEMPPMSISMKNEQGIAVVSAVTALPRA